jgi:hypothetical protein
MKTIDCMEKKNICPRLLDTNTFVIELANGLAPGYVYTEDALSTGGYETDTSMLSYESGYKIVRKAVDMLNNSK